MSITIKELKELISDKDENLEVVIQVEDESYTVGYLEITKAFLEEEEEEPTKVVDVFVLKADL